MHSSTRYEPPAGTARSRLPPLAPGSVATRHAADHRSLHREPLSVSGSFRGEPSRVVARCRPGGIRAYDYLGDRRERSTRQNFSCWRTSIARESHSRRAAERCRRDARQRSNGKPETLRFRARGAAARPHLLRHTARLGMRGRHLCRGAHSPSGAVEPPDSPLAGALPQQAPHPISDQYVGQVGNQRGHHAPTFSGSRSGDSTWHRLRGLLGRGRTLDRLHDYLTHRLANVHDASPLATATEGRSRAAPMQTSNVIRPRES
jgi:hypothetical protein